MYMISTDEEDISSNFPHRWFIIIPNIANASRQATILPTIYQPSLLNVWVAFYKLRNS